ncbi:hypothetical protein RJT34_13027 [Clitoria ternatea]|uniref:Uncharacterized protein n=1 Tax=Clitoria ternatea TaxID=43366 RepID=A0AAN9JQ57_CLITE
MYSCTYDHWKFGFLVFEVKYWKFEGKLFIPLTFSLTYKGSKINGVIFNGDGSFKMKREKEKEKETVS